MRRVPVFAVVAVLLAACGASPAPAFVPEAVSPARTTTDAPPATATTTTTAGVGGAPAYGVLVDELSSPTIYTIAIVSRKGAVRATVQAARRTPIGSADGTAIDLPYVSTTSDALYYLDGDATVRVLHLNGFQADGEAAAHLQLTAGMEAAFAVSPDDTRIAVGVLDFSRSPVHVLLYVQALTTGNRHVIFESDTDYVWPVAWHGGLLVLAHAYGAYVEQALKAAPSRDNPYWAISYHLIDPTTAVRKLKLGSCTVSGPLSPAGSGCIQGGSVDWSGATESWSSTHDWGSINGAAAISPDGAFMAAADPDHPDQLDFWRPDGTIATFVDGPGAQNWAGWLDGQTVIIASGTSLDWRPRIVTLAAGPTPVVFFNARGYYAARLPTDID